MNHTCIIFSINPLNTLIIALIVELCVFKKLLDIVTGNARKPFLSLHQNYFNEHKTIRRTT
jgi:hypothetical protein